MSDETAALILALAIENAELRAQLSQARRNLALARADRDTLMIHVRR